MSDKKLDYNLSVNAKSLDKVYIRTEELFKAHKEIILVHQGCEYHLRITSNDKLILTK
jgi:hemin uptake protein HemP